MVTGIGDRALHSPIDEVAQLNLRILSLPSRAKKAQISDHPTDFRRE